MCISENNLKSCNFNLAAISLVVPWKPAHSGSVIILSNYAKQTNILQNFSRLNANNADTGLLRLTLKLETIVLTACPVIITFLHENTSIFKLGLHVDLSCAPVKFPEPYLSRPRHYCTHKNLTADRQRSRRQWLKLAYSDLQLNKNVHFHLIHTPVKCRLSLFWH